MYLTPKLNNELDKIVKNFEVAYRSYIADKIINQYPSKDHFINYIDGLLNTTTATSVIQTGKYEGKLKKIKSSKETFYQSIKYSFDCLVNGNYTKGNQNVLYVSEIIDLTMLLFNPLFTDLGKLFETIELFIYHSEKYKQIRNDLSHPAASKILMQDAKDVLLFITLITKTIDEKYFWYSPKQDIDTYISDFYTMGDEDAFKVHNLNEIPWDNNTILFRDNEIDLLEDVIVGRDEFYRRAGSLVVYGFGGVGKTALILEFIRQIHRKILSDSLRVKFDFLLFFSNKEEELTATDSNGDLTINPLRCDVQTFNNLKANILSYLEIEMIKDAMSKYNRGGIIVIDNFETFSKKDKKEIMEFIRRSPRNIQYILTSRNEEQCEEKINLKGFNEDNKGIEFIQKYSDLMDFDLEHVSEDQKKQLLYESQGNTLIILLALERISSKKKSIEEILAELSTVSTENTEVIAEFMYKNTFDQAIGELKERSLEVIDVLRVIALYDEPVDIFSLSKITDVKIKNVETICVYLATKLILSKNEDLFSMSEFATKFIFFNLLPHEVERKKLEETIITHKSDLKKNMEFLDENINKYSDLKNIMSDWKPTNYVDKIAITEVYAMYDLVKNKKNPTMQHIKEMDEKINSIEVRTPHPYIRFQKARIFKQLMERFKKSDEKIFCSEIVGEYLERTIMTIKYNYPNIKSTKSYAAVLWIQALSLNEDRDGDIGETIKYLEEARHICERYNHTDDEMYYKILIKLSIFNEKQFDKVQEQVYLENCLELLETVLNGKTRDKMKDNSKMNKKRIERRLKDFNQSFNKTRFINQIKS